MAKQPVTEAQQGFIAKLLSQREVGPTTQDMAKAVQFKGEASAMIDVLKACPVKSNSPALVEPGYYLLDGETPCVVVMSKQNRPYAKVLVEPAPDSNSRARWDYDRGAVYRLAGKKPLTIEQASEFGRLYGFCLCCGVPMDTVLSNRVGIGPSCVKKYYGMTQKQFLAAKGEALAVVA